MNLAFTTEGGHIIDFPFQTPTDLTYRVLALDNDFDKLDAITDELTKWKWSKKEIKEMKYKIINLMNDSTLKLCII